MAPTWAIDTFLFQPAHLNVLPSPPFSPLKGAGVAHLLCTEHNCNGSVQPALPGFAILQPSPSPFCQKYIWSFPLLEKVLGGLAANIASTQEQNKERTISATTVLVLETYSFCVVPGLHLQPFT